jgi:hypothetical protein
MAQDTDMRRVVVNVVIKVRVLRKDSAPWK